MATGTVKHWNGARGFGFIGRDDGAGDIFAHIRDVRGRPDSLAQGQRVQFEEGINSRNGKPQAEKVEISLGQRGTSLNLSAEEQQAVSDFKSSSETQEAERPLMRAQGAEFGRRLNAAVQSELRLAVLLSNSGRCSAAKILSEQIEAQAARLRLIGYDECNVDLYTAAAKSELAWMGV